MATQDVYNTLSLVIMYSNKYVEIIQHVNTLTAYQIREKESIIFIQLICRENSSDHFKSPKCNSEFKLSIKRKFLLQ